MITSLSGCQRCPRLVKYIADLVPKKQYSREDYWNKPVPGFGDCDARIWLLGLAPGAHGANRSGRPFTGDGAGDFMYPLLYRAGLSNQPHSCSRDDSLRLLDMYISNVVKCVPPGNKPNGSEFCNCRVHLLDEMCQMKQLQVVLALGRDAFISILRLLKELNVVDRIADYPFAHDAAYRLPNGLWLLASYHTSRYNVQTRRINEASFLRVLLHARELLE